MTDNELLEATQRRLPGTPFVGLVPYGEGDAAFFFGRDEEKEIVTGNLRAARLTILYGASGVGKTSLLHAGVMHDLHQQLRANAAGARARTPFAICAFSAWRVDPLRALAEAMRQACVEGLAGKELPPWEPGGSLVDMIRAWTERVRPLLVVLDQFEDYFLYHPDEDGEGTFAVEFPRLVNELNLRVNFMLSLREDAWAKLDQFEGQIPTLFANYVRVEHLNRQAARAAIVGPVKEWNRRLPPGEEPYAVEPALVESVIEAAAAGRFDLTEGGDAGGPREARTDAIEAPFLQLVLERLWRATVEAGEHTLDLARLEVLGGAQQIVENHLLEALGKLTPAEQGVAADLFRFLVTRSKTKIAHPATDLAEWTKHAEPEVSAVLDKLCRGESGRILRSISPPAGETSTSYELFHDVLAEPILVWRRDFEAERSRRAARRRFLRIGGTLLALVVLFGALGIVALLQRNEARDATRSAASLALVSAADDQLATRPDVSLLLGFEAYRARQTIHARSGMISALERARQSGTTEIFHGHAGPVRGVALSADGATLASVGDDGTVRLWDVQNHKKLGQPLRGHTGSVVGVALSRDGTVLASAGDDGTLRLWDVRARKQFGQPFVGHTGPVAGVAFSPDGTMLVSAGYDGTVRLWDVRTQRQLGRPLEGHRGYVLGVAFSPDGTRVASAGLDKTVRLWDVRTHKQLGKPLLGHAGPVVAVAFSPDGATLASGGYDENVLLWDVDTHAILGRLHAQTGPPVYAVAFSPDGSTLASANDDGTVRLWDMRAHRQLGEPLSGHTGPVRAVAFGANATTIASGSADGTVRVWDTRRDPDRRLYGHKGHVEGVVFSADGATLVSAGYDGTVRLWEAHTGRQRGRPLAPLLGRAHPLRSVAVSPDGATLASAGDDGTVRLWNVPARQQLGEPLKPLSVHTKHVFAVAFSPDGSTLASANDDGTVLLWDVRTHKQLGKPLLGHAGPVAGVAFSPDGTKLASAGYDKTVRLWDVRTQRQLGRSLLGHTGPVDGVAFSPDGTMLASAGFDGTLRLWDVRTHGQLGEPLSGHTGSVVAVAFSPDGSTLVSGGSDGTLRLWDVTTHKQLGEPLSGHSGAVEGVAFSPDGTMVASAGDDGTVRLWDLIRWHDFGDLEDQVCRLVVGELTGAEWEDLVPGVAYHATCPS